MPDLDDGKKLNIVIVLLTVVLILNVLTFLRSRARGFGLANSWAILASKNPRPRVLPDKPSLRQPGGYHYSWVERMVKAGQKKINTNNPNLDLEACRKAYFDYYARQSKEEAGKALLMIHKCER